MDNSAKAKFAQLRQQLDERLKKAADAAPPQMDMDQVITWLRVAIGKLIDLVNQFLVWVISFDLADFLNWLLIFMRAFVDLQDKSAPEEA